MKIKINNQCSVPPIFIAFFLGASLFFILNASIARACTNPPIPSIQSVLFGYEQDPDDPKCFFSVYSIYDIYCINGVTMYGQNRFSVGEKTCQRPEGAPPGSGPNDICGDCMLLREWGEWTGPSCVNQGLCAIRGTYETVQLSAWTNTNCPCEVSSPPPPPPICTPNCTECSAVCGWGTKSCIDVNCITQDGIACYNRACECQNPPGWPNDSSVKLCAGSNTTPAVDTIKTLFNNGACSGSGSCLYECLWPRARTEFNCQPPVDGACANIGNKSYCQKPSTNICLHGTPSDPTVNGDNWEWKCEGMFGGDDSPEICKALKSCAYREVVPN